LPRRNQPTIRPIGNGSHQGEARRDTDLGETFRHEVQHIALPLEQPIEPSAIDRFDQAGSDLRVQRGSEASP
jgi:hypothetical protein